MNWVRPYLRHIKRLTMDEEKMKTPDLISAFEGSMIEVELLAHQLPVGDELAQKDQHWQAAGGKQNKKYHSCVLVHFMFRTRPAMSFQQEGYQRGPIHVGRVQMDFRSYVWDKEQIDNYIAMKDSEDLELMETISGSVKAAMEGLGAELLRYIDEAKGLKHKKIKKLQVHNALSDSLFDTLIAPLKGMGELIGSFKPRGTKKPFRDIMGESKEKDIALSRCKWNLYHVYKGFKREHKMMHWL